MDAAAFTAILDVSAPVLLLIVVGAFLRLRGSIDDAFISSGSRFVFAVGMPTLLFFSMQGAHFDQLISWHMPAYFALSILMTFGFAWWIAARIDLPHRARGAFIQVAFRGNTGVLSFALVVNMFGDEGMVIGGIMASITSIFFNILAELVFSRYQNNQDFRYGSLVKTIVRNPMILGVVAGITANVVDLPVPSQVVATGKYLGGVTLPLALLCVGASLARSRFSLSKAMSLAIAIKTFISPVFFTCLAAFIGFSHHELLYLFLFLGSPVAASAYVVAVSHGDDGRETANAIATSTLLSAIILLFFAPLLLAWL